MVVRWPARATVHRHICHLGAADGRTHLAADLSPRRHPRRRQGHRVVPDLSPDLVAVIGFVTLFALMLLRVPVGMAMGLVGVSGYGYLTGSGPALKMVGQTSMRIV